MALAVDVTAAAVMASWRALLTAQITAAVLPALAVLALIAWQAQPLPARLPLLMPVLLLGIGLPGLMMAAHGTGPTVWVLGLGPALLCLALIATGPAWRPWRPR